MIISTEYTQSTILQHLELQYPLVRSILTGCHPDCSAAVQPHTQQTVMLCVLCSFLSEPASTSSAVWAAVARLIDQTTHTSLSRPRPCRWLTAVTSFGPLSQTVNTPKELQFWTCFDTVFWQSQFDPCQTCSNPYASIHYPFFSASNISSGDKMFTAWYIPLTHRSHDEENSVLFTSPVSGHMLRLCIQNRNKIMRRVWDCVLWHKYIQSPP